MKILSALLCLLCLCSPLPAAAQALSPAQVTALKSICAVDATCAALGASADDVGLAAWFNAADPAACVVWRHDISIPEAHAVMVWTEVDAMSAGKARIWEWMRNVQVLDARQLNIRQGLSDAFASATATRTAPLALAKRNATRAERALASGACTSGSPSITTWTGPISFAVARQSAAASSSLPRLVHHYKQIGIMQ